MSWRRAEGWCYPQATYFHKRSYRYSIHFLSLGSLFLCVFADTQGTHTTSLGNGIVLSPSRQIVLEKGERIELRLLWDFLFKPGSIWPHMLGHCWNYSASILISLLACPSTRSVVINRNVWQIYTVAVCQPQLVSRVLLLPKYWMLIKSGSSTSWFSNLLSCIILLH